MNNDSIRIPKYHIQNVHTNRPGFQTKARFCIQKWYVVRFLRGNAIMTAAADYEGRNDGRSICETASCAKVFKSAKMILHHF